MARKLCQTDVVLPVGVPSCPKWRIVAVITKKYWYLLAANQEHNDAVQPFLTFIIL
jgi:hypothetical protein